MEHKIRPCPRFRFRSDRQRASVHGGSRHGCRTEPRSGPTWKSLLGPRCWDNDELAKAVWNIEDKNQLTDPRWNEDEDEQIDPVYGRKYHFRDIFRMDAPIEGGAWHIMNTRNPQHWYNQWGVAYSHIHQTPQMRRERQYVSIQLSRILRHAGADKKVKAAPL